MRSLRIRLGRRADVRIVGIFVAVFVVLSIVAPTATSSMDQMLARASVNGLVALGLTMVIVQGGLDLSVGSTLAVAAIVTVEVSETSLALSILAAVGVGLAVGLLNGFIVTVLQVNSFIATLGTMVAIRGVAYVATDSTPVSGGSIEASLALTRKVVWFLTPEMLILLGAIVVCHLFLSRTRVGREFYAVGGNIAAARASGTPVRRRLVEGFVFAGMLSGLAGWVLATELNSGSPAMGSDVALLGIAAVVVGGASLTGGRGTALGTAVGVFTIALLSTALDLEGVASSYKDIATGLILLVVVAADQFTVPMRLTAWWQGVRGRREAANPPARVTN